MLFVQAAMGTDCAYIHATQPDRGESSDDGDPPVLCVTARSLFVFVCYSGYTGFVISMHNKSISYNGLDS